MENQDKIIEFEAKIKKIEEKLNTSIIYDESFFKRAIGIFGHNLVGQIILFISKHVGKKTWSYFFSFK